MLLAVRPKAVEQGALVLDLDEGAAELGMIAVDYLAAELLGHQLLAVADAEHRHPRLEQFSGRARTVGGGDRSGAAGEDDPLGLDPLEALEGAAEGDDLAVDAGLAHPARDELGHLASEIDDEDGIAGLDGHGGAIVRGPPPVKASDRQAMETA